MTGTTARGATEHGKATAGSDLARLRDVAQAPSTERALEAMREFLGMEVAYTSALDDTAQVIEVLHGDAESFGLEPGTEIPLEDTYCQRILTGRLPNLIPDTRADERAASVPVTESADIGAFVSVPLRFSDGSLHGMLCAASHRAHPSLGSRELQFLHVVARMIADGLERHELERSAHGLELQATAAQTLIAAVHARDAYTAAHSRELVAHAVWVAERLGLGGEQVIDVRHVALLHDIGKLAIPDTILSKPGPLDDEEWAVMRTHSARGADLIRGTPGLAHLAAAIRAEHERWDGRGYPDGLAGEDIPMASRITFVCDAYHAMTSDRPYRRALSAADARAEIEAGTGSQFCPRAGNAFLAVLDESG